jgi:hypothetical protein
MKNFAQSLLIPVYALLGFMMMVPFILSFLKEEMIKKLQSKKASLPTDWNN